MRTAKYLAGIIFLLLFVAADLPVRNPFPEVERYKLKNGLEVIFADYGTLPVTSFTFFVNVGKKSETPGQQGLADLAAGALAMGNEKYARMEQDQLLYRMGTGISSGSNSNYSVVSASFLNRDVEKGMDLLAAALTKPTLPQVEIDEMKGFNLAQNKPSKMDIGQLASVYGDYFTFGIEHPLGRHFYEAQYKKITAAQVKEFYSFNFTPANTKLVVLGKPDRALVKKLIEQQLGGWTAIYGEVNSAAYDVASIKEKEYAFVNKSGAEQAYLQWIKKSPTAGSKDENAFRIANSIFTERLMDDIREKRGYTYGIYSSYSEDENEGVFRVRTQVRSEVMLNTIQAFDGALADFYKNGVTDTELLKIKMKYRNEILGIETPGAFAMQMNPWVYKDYNKRKQYLQQIEALDIATINKTIQKYFSPDSYKLVIAGDEKVLNEQLAGLPNLQRLDLSVIEN
ncbi:MAG TPA: pitrilysin family protein [Bacteroidia bacterium]|nr:pitrilysin family protein [Bacteroidia bacterium]